MDNLKAAQETLSKYQEEDFFPDQQEVQCSQVTCESEAPELKSDNEESQETKPEDNGDAAFDFRVKKNRERAVQFAMKILTARKNSANVAPYSLSVAFFRLLNRLAKNLACFGIMDLTNDDWENLGDDFAQQKFTEWTELVQLEEFEVAHVGKTFCMFCLIIGQLLEEEERMIEDNFEQE